MLFFFKDFISFRNRDREREKGEEQRKRENQIPEVMT